MTSAVFVDTSAWYAVTDRSDELHPRAGAIVRRLSQERRPLLTTNHVVAETYTLLRIRLGFRAAYEFLERTRSSPLTQRIFIREEWEKEAEALLARYRDQDFSYVDATSFVAMKRLGVRDALAFDTHFSTAGFIVLQ